MFTPLRQYVELTVDGSVSISGGLSVGGLGEGPAIVCASGGNLFLDDGGVVPCDADLTPWLIDENGLAVKIASSLKNLEGTYKKTVYGSRFIIENREEETHYFDQIYLEQRIIRGRRMTVKKYYADSPDADLINNADETYLVLRQGDRVDFSFDIPPRERAGEFQLVVKGWYEKLSGIGSQQGQEVITLPEDDDNQPEPSANSISLPILESEQAISTVESSIKKDTLSPADTEATEETPDDDNNTGEILPDTQTEPQPAPPPEAIPEQETGGASTSTAQEASKEPEPKGDKPPENP
jgi:hypothetical protein